MAPFRNVAVCRYKYLKNSKKRIVGKKEHTIDTEEEDIAMENPMTTRTLGEFFYRPKATPKNKGEAKKLITKGNRNTNGASNNDEL